MNDLKISLNMILLKNINNQVFYIDGVVIYES
jgi:hypothetical protein